MTTPCLDAAPRATSRLASTLIPAAVAQWRRALAILAPPSRHPASEHAWQRALPELLDMDSHILKDIGAPAWVMAQVQQRRLSQFRRRQAVLHLNCPRHKP